MVDPGKACRNHNTRDQEDWSPGCIEYSIHRLGMNRLCDPTIQQETRACVFILNGVDALKQIRGSVIIPGNYKRKTKKPNVISNDKKKDFLCVFLWDWLAKLLPLFRVSAKPMILL